MAPELLSFLSPDILNKKQLILRTCCREKPLQNPALDAKMALGGRVIFKNDICLLPFSFIPIQVGLKLCAHCLGGLVWGEYVIYLLGTPGLSCGVWDL